MLLAVGSAACGAPVERPAAPAAFPWDSVAAAAPTSDVVLGFAAPFEKVFADPPIGFTGTLGSSAEISLARNERESIQLVLFPLRALGPIRVEAAEPVARRSGAAPSIRIRVVGEVNLLTPRHPGGRAGWHPDPLLPNRPLAL